MKNGTLRRLCVCSSTASSTFLGSHWPVQMCGAVQGLLNIASSVCVASDYVICLNSIINVVLEALGGDVILQQVPPTHQAVK